MDLSNLLDTVQGALGNKLPGIFGALIILVLGWIVAMIVRAVLRGGLRRAGLNSRTNSGMDLESLIAKIVFWVIMAFVLLAFFNALDLQAVSKPLDALLSQVMAFLPKLISGAILGIVAFVIAKVVKSLVANGLAKTTLDEKLAGEAGVEAGTGMSANLANIAFWLIILLFLPMVLGVLELKGLLGPVQAMFDKLLAALPNIIGALIIGAVGYFVAKILREIVTNLTAASGVDNMALKAGVGGNTRLSKLLGTVVFILVFVPALIAALEQLNIAAISGPATQMLDQFMGAIPNIIAAALILGITWFVAKLIVGFLVSLLQGVGFDEFPAKMGFANLASGGTSLSNVAGKVVMFFAMLFASVEAANRLGFSQVRDVVTMFIEFGGQILLGAVILGVGFWMANLVHKVVSQMSGGGAANVARFAVMALVIAMGLRAMGLADDIVNMAFGLTLGAIAVAVALSFGLGGREAAGEKMAEWLRKMG